jgi:hypothetical protein
MIMGVENDYNKHIECFKISEQFKIGMKEGA